MTDEQIKIKVMHTGKVRIRPELAFGGDNCSMVKASGVFHVNKGREWFPVSSVYVEHPKGKFVIDTGWDRSMSPNGVYDKKAQIKSLGSYMLWRVNQGMVPTGMTATEQLARIGIKPSDIDYVLVTHLDCDHANGINQFKGAKHIMASNPEIKDVHHSKMHGTRFQPRWWNQINLEGFDWNDNQGPFRRSYDLFGDGSVELINIPGHTDGLFAVKIKNKDGKFWLFVSDGGYGHQSWEKMITSGICVNKEEQKKSLEWIREQSLDPNCVEVMANHDKDIKPHEITL